MPSLKSRVWSVVAPETEDHTGQQLETAKVVLATMNVVAVILQSVDWLSEALPLFFEGFAIVSILLFMLLYVVRLWASPTDPEYRGAEGRLRLLRRPYSLLDLVVIVGFWVGLLFFDDSLGSVRVLWFARIFDIPRLNRSQERFKRVLAAQREDLVIAFSGAAMLALVSSTLMFFVEGRAQPEAFGSIPAALWWGVVTLTTVGYGDVVPTTPLGRLLGGLTTIGGIAFFALPSSVLAAGFLAEREREEQEALEAAESGPERTEAQTTQSGAIEATSQNRCPHCGESLDPTGTANR
ncbi:ion transporter [Haloferax namakaokahaiae]|uniref:Ion transporter n=1 Tax=Haloferax namakaokahaiae TaxID=1748331 RepID=A0ABD5ZI44_9EURY